MAADAGLDVPAEAIDLVARRGKGSVRDALSVLDQVAAAGGIDHDAPVRRRAFVEALCDRDAAAALVAVAERCGAGHDPRQVATDMLERLRQALLVTCPGRSSACPTRSWTPVEAEAHRLGRPATVRAMEVLGETLVDMREAPDPRVLLEVALVRLCRPELDSSPAALLERIERLERAAGRAAGAGAQAGAAARRPHHAGASRPRADAAAAGAAASRPRPAAAGSGGGRRPAGPRRACGRRPSRSAPPAPPPRPPRRRLVPPAAAAPAPAPAAAARRACPSRDELTLAWGDKVLLSLSPRAKSRFRVGRFVASEGGRAMFALPNAIHRDRCEEVRVDVEQALAAHFGRPVPLRLVTEEPGHRGRRPPRRGARAARRRVDRPRRPRRMRRRRRYARPWITSFRRSKAPPSWRNSSCPRTHLVASPT